MVRMARLIIAGEVTMRSGDAAIADERWVEERWRMQTNAKLKRVRNLLLSQEVGPNECMRVRLA